MLLVNFIVTNSKSVPNQSYDIFVPKLAKNMTPTYKKTIPNPTMVRFGIYSKTLIKPLNEFLSRSYFKGDV